MLTLDNVLQSYSSKTLDDRDISRLLDFVPVEKWASFGFSLKEGIDPSTVEISPWTEDNIKARMRNDVEFGFEKALNKRGISAGLMVEVVCMWLFILEDKLMLDFAETNYPQYGLPIFKAVAQKYGFPNPIGDDEGTEEEYEG